MPCWRPATGKLDDAMTDVALIVGQDERAAGRLRPEQHRKAALLLHTAGCVVLRDLLPAQLIDRLRAAFNGVLQDCIASKQGDGWYQVSAREQAVFWERAARWRIFPKLRPPFDDQALLANPVISSLLEEILGQEFFCKFVSSDTCARGSVTQPPHREFSAGGAIAPGAYFVNVPLARSSLENGPIEIWPTGTHLWQSSALSRYHVSDEVQDGENPAMEQFAELFPSQKLILEPGSVLMRNPGMLHRGTANPTDVPRTMLTLCYVRRGYQHDYGDIRFNLDDALYEGLSPAVRQIFAGSLAARDGDENSKVEHAPTGLWPWRRTRRRSGRVG
jgi:ectoine hydroxylase-related dioxygenase (phytanoyl-CoA dioxygenase family)